MRAILTILLLFLLANSYSQQLGQVTFSGGANFSHFGFVTDQGVLIRISDDGKILEFGTEALADRSNFYARKLQPFMGRIDYYGPKDDSIFSGKIKSIGTCFFTYYDEYQKKSKAGKIKTIGNQLIDYFEEYEDKTLQGKIKTAGALSIDYYRSYENESYRGKLKMIGSLPITYYSVFDDKINAGKLKSVGSVQYQWYSFADRPDMRGALKGNAYRQVISGITFILN